MKNSMRQLFRTPVKTGLFCIIFILGTMLFSVGLNLWIEISAKLKAADDVFVTIGTVSQKEQSTVIEERWDAGLKDYIYQEKNVYGGFLDPEILESAEIEYVSSPKQRPYFGTRSPGTLTGGELTDADAVSVSLAEFRALEDCVPEGPVPVEVVRVLWGDRSLLGKTVYFCDHTTRQPKSMESGKTYISFISMNPLNVDRHEGFTELLEYMPLRLYENQARLWEPAGDDFYETEKGQKWEQIAGMLETCYEKMLPATPVSDLQLLKPFHDGDAVLEEGRSITQAEYERGAGVCLISQKFAKINDLQVGDRLPLEFYYADYKYPLCQVAGQRGGLMERALDADGNVLDAFQEREYEIIGIYSCPVTLTNDPHAFAANQIFVPERSVSEPSGEHVLYRGPMQAYNTSFRIKNGSIERFLETCAKLPERDLLEIQFDDGGYETFASKMHNTRIVAAVLFAAGLALLAATTAFLMYFMILKQRKRTAIEQALGMTRRQCIVSLLGGIMVLTAVCAAAGGAAGTQMNRILQEAAVQGEEKFSTAYTKGVMEERTWDLVWEDSAENEMLPESGSMWIRAGLTAVCETGLVGILALFFISRNLQSCRC